MLSRTLEIDNDPSLSEEVKHAKETLALLGWSYRAAAPLLGVNFSHLAKVLTGRRESKRLLAAIAALPPRPKVTA